MELPSVVVLAVMFMVRVALLGSIVRVLVLTRGALVRFVAGSI